MRNFIEVTTTGNQPAEFQPRVLIPVDTLLLVMDASDFPPVGELNPDTKAILKTTASDEVCEVGETYEKVRQLIKEATE